MRDPPYGAMFNRATAFGRRPWTETTMSNDITPASRGTVMTQTAESKPEQHQVAGDRLVERIKELVRQGNIRRVIVKNDDGKTLMEIPLTIGVVSAVLLPVWVALGAIAALAAQYTIEVEKTGE